MNLPCHFAVLTIGNCIRSAARLPGGRTCRSMHWRSHEVFGNKVVPRRRRIPQFLTETSPDPQSSRHMRQLSTFGLLKPKVEVQVLSGRPKIIADFDCDVAFLPVKLSHFQKWSRSSGILETANSCLRTAKVGISNVRFTPESGHVQCSGQCPLWAISGHQRPL